MEVRLSFCILYMQVLKAPLGQNRHKYMCLQASLQHYILCSVGAKPLFNTLIKIAMFTHYSSISSSLCIYSGLLFRMIFRFERVRSRCFWRNVLGDMPLI